MATKGVDMSTGVVVADWVKRLVDDERKRDAMRVRKEEDAARKADLVRVHGRRLIDELRATVTRDVEAFRDEFAGDCVRDIVLEATEPEGRFVVRKPAAPAVSPRGRATSGRRSDGLPLPVHADERHAAA